MKLPVVFTRVGFATYRFRSRRADYYEYLADIIQATAGQRTIKQIFQTDAARYGPKTIRGILSGHWAHRIEEEGDLAHTFAGTLPEGDVRLLGMLQRLGGEALIDGLRDMAALVRLDEKIKNIFRSSTLVGFIVGLIVLLMLVLMPTVTVPQLQENFGDFEPHLYRPLTNGLFGFSDWLADYGLLAAAAGAGLLGLFLWSLKNVHGTIRNWVDEHTPVGIYRDTQAIRVLVSIATIIKPRGTLNIRLREAIDLLSTSADPWLQSHLEDVMDNLDNSVSGARAFNTGLLDKQVYWYLEDLVDALGLGSALQKARIRLETRTLEAVARRALVFNWVMLFAGIGFLLLIMAWHYRVLFELRDLMVLTSM